MSWSLTHTTFSPNVVAYGGSKINVVPESVIATREGEMILEDEILRDGDEVKLIAVISGGAGIDTRISNYRITRIEYEM